MKQLYLTGILLSIMLSVWGQTGINTESPRPHTALDINHIMDGSDTIAVKGISIPSLTTAQRNAFPVSELPDNFIIYNTDENCYNYYVTTTAEWKSICGKTESKATVQCDSIFIYGSYQKGVTLTPDEKIVVNVNVEETGNYTLSAVAYGNDGVTPNGYYAWQSSSFVITGNNQIVLNAIGTPVNATTANSPDSIKIYLNNTLACTVPLSVSDPAIQTDYTVNCTNINIQGNYIKGMQLTADNYLECEITVNSGAGGAISLQTDTVNGYYFSYEGTAPAGGTTTVRLQGIGTPLENQKDIFNLKANGVSNCNVEIDVLLRNVRLLSIMADPTVFNNMENIILNQQLFGEDQSALYKTVGFEYKELSTANMGLLKDTINSFKPDIIFFHQDNSQLLTTDDATTLQSYVQQRGVLLYCSSNNSDSQTILQNILGSGITVNTTVGATTASPIMNSSSTILNTPYDITGQSINTSANLGISITTIPLDKGIIISPIGNTSATNKSNARIIISRAKNAQALFYCSDGLVFSDSNTTVDGNNMPTNTNAQLLVNTLSLSLDFIQNYRRSGNEPINIE